MAPPPSLPHAAAHGHAHAHTHAPAHAHAHSHAHSHAHTHVHTPAPVPAPAPTPAPTPAPAAPPKKAKKKKKTQYPEGSVAADAGGGLRLKSLPRDDDFHFADEGSSSLDAAVAMKSKSSDTSGSAPLSSPKIENKNTVSPSQMEAVVPRSLQNAEAVEQCLNAGNFSERFDLNRSPKGIEELSGISFGDTILHDLELDSCMTEENNTLQLANNSCSVSEESQAVLELKMCSEEDTDTAILEGSLSGNLTKKLGETNKAKINGNETEDKCHVEESLNENEDKTREMSRNELMEQKHSNLFVKMQGEVLENTAMPKFSEMNLNVMLDSRKNYETGNEVKEMVESDYRKIIMPTIHELPHIESEETKLSHLLLNTHKSEEINTSLSGDRVPKEHESEKLDATSEQNIVVRESEKEKKNENGLEEESNRESNMNNNCSIKGIAELENKDNSVTTSNDVNSNENIFLNQKNNDNEVEGTMCENNKWVLRTWETVNPVPDQKLNGEVPIALRERDEKIASTDQCSTEMKANVDENYSFLPLMNVDVLNNKNKTVVCKKQNPPPKLKPLNDQPERNVNNTNTSQSNSTSGTSSQLTKASSPSTLPVNEEILDVQSMELAGPFLGCVVESFPRSGVATFRLQGISTRAYFFRNSVVGNVIPTVGTHIILENLERVTPSLQTMQYKSTINAKRVSACSDNRQAITGRTGAIRKYIDANTGLIEVSLPDKEVILAKFTKQEIRTGAISGGKSIQKVWPVGTVVHFHGELITNGNDQQCIITHVWPQGTGAVLHKSSPEKEKLTPKVKQTEEKIVTKEKVSAHTGRVSQYYSPDHGLIDFRLRDLQLSAEFKVGYCSGLLLGKSLAEQWPPATIVHFDGELIRSGTKVKFVISKVWAGKRTISISLAPELPPGPHIGEVTELRPPAAFVVTLTKPSRLLRVFVLSLYFRTALGEPQLRKIIPLKGYVRLRQRMWVKIKSVNPDSQKDCDYIATDAWPETVKNIDELKSKSEINANTAFAEKSKFKGVTDITTRKKIVVQDFIKELGNNSQEGLTSSTKASRIQERSPACKVVKEASTNRGSPSLQTPGDADLLLKTPDPVHAGEALHARVILANSTGALLRVIAPGRPADAPLVAVHARGLFLCGVVLAGIDLTLVLAPGQELDVYFLKEDEERFTTEFSVNSSTPALQNCVYLSALWLVQARFESPSVQFVELTKFCKEHKVTDSIYHQLTQRLGQTLKEERDKRPGYISDDDGDDYDEDDYDEENDDNDEDYCIIEKEVIQEEEMVQGECQENGIFDPETPNGSVKQNTPQDMRSVFEENDDCALEAQVRQELKEIGPEQFLRGQLIELTHSVLQESLCAAQDYFLKSLKEHCSDSALCNLFALEVPAIVQSAAQEFILEKLNKVPGNGPKNGASWTRASGPGPSRACTGCAGARAAETAAAGPAAPPPAGDDIIAEGAAGAVAESGAPARVAAAALASPATARAPAGQHQSLLFAAEPAVAPSSLVEGARGSPVKGCEAQDDWTLSDEPDGAGGQRVKQVCGAASLLLHGIQNILRGTQEELNATADSALPVCAMQETPTEEENITIQNASPELNVVGDQETKLVEKEQNQTSATTEGSTFDCRDFHKSLNEEIRKHAKELAVFREEAYRLIENWKSADSPPATPEELEFLQELSLLLDAKPDNTDKNSDETYGLAQQLLKFWNAANFPLTPVARRGLQRLQEALEVPDMKTEGTEKMEHPVCAGPEDIREVEAALKEVRDAFRDVKHVFEVQRCFRDLRECFRDVRRAYRTREPRPRALPPCADAPAAAAAAATAAAVAAEAIAQAKKRGRTASEVSGSRTPSPAGTPTHSQPKKKQQQPQHCANCKLGRRDGTGEGLVASAENAPSTTQTADNSQTEVSRLSQSTGTMTNDLTDVAVTTAERAAQTISTGAVLALHLLPDE